MEVNVMKYIVSILAIMGVLSVSLTVPVTAAEVVDKYVKGTYQYTCIMQGDHKYCGNWKVAF
jgi:hypothetical protein